MSEVKEKTLDAIIPSLPSHTALQNEYDILITGRVIDRECLRLRDKTVKVTQKAARSDIDALLDAVKTGDFTGLAWLANSKTLLSFIEEA